MREREGGGGGGESIRMPSDITYSIRKKRETKQQQKGQHEYSLAGRTRV